MAEKMNTSQKRNLIIAFIGLIIEIYGANNSSFLNWIGLIIGWYGILLYVTKSIYANDKNLKGKK